jgi:glutaredoxin 3
MTKTRQIDIYSAGCPVCEQTVTMVTAMACPSCEVTVLDMTQPDIAARAAALGIGAVPAVVIDGKLADCCKRGGPDEATLRAAGIGSPLG